MTIDKIYLLLKQYIKDIQPYYIEKQMFNCLYSKQYNFVCFVDDKNISTYKEDCLSAKYYFNENNITLYRVKLSSLSTVDNSSNNMVYDNFNEENILDAISYILELEDINFDKLDCNDFEQANDIYIQDVKKLNNLHLNMCKDYIKHNQIPFITPNDIYNKFYIGTWYCGNSITFDEEIDGNLYKIDKVDNSTWSKHFSICKYLKSCDININMLKYDYMFKNYPIGLWLNIQRNEYKDKIMNNDRIKMLESLDFVWNKFHDQWDATFDLLKEWCELNNTKNVPKATIYKNVRIGYWYQTQKKEFNNGLIYPDRLEKLKAFGLSMGNAAEEKWERNFNLYIEYIGKTGNPHISRRTLFKDEKLGQWVDCQRKSYNKGSMSKQHYEKLKEYIEFE